MTDVHHNSFDDKLERVQADLAGLRRRHQDLHTELRHRFNALDARFDNLDLRLETDRGNAPVFQPIRAH